MTEEKRQEIIKELTDAGIEFDVSISCQNESYWLKKAAEILEQGL